MQSSLATGRAPTLGRARVAPSASSRSNLGAGRAMRGFGSESLRGSGRAAGVTLPRRRAATPCRAKTLEERIASGEFTKPRSSPAEDLLNGFRGLIRNVDNPQGECRNASRTKPRAHRRPAPSPLVSRLDRSIVGSIAIDAPMISSRARERESPGESRPRRASRPASVRPFPRLDKAPPKCGLATMMCAFADRPFVPFDAPPNSPRTLRVPRQALPQVEERVHEPHARRGG